MDDRSDIEEKLKGWEFDVEALRASEGAFSPLARSAHARISLTFIRPSLHLYKV
jgi:hypothetical protein